MTPGEVATYRVVHNAAYWDLPDFRGAWGGDGYDQMDAGRQHGWKAVSSWGTLGWDLGSWPLVAILVRERGSFELCQVVEGDVSIWRFPTPELRIEAIDGIAWYWWHHLGASFVAEYKADDPIPEHFRGEFRRERLPA